MNNADKPINPVEVSGDGEGNIQGMQTGNYSGWEIGLTKREYFAGLAMQGLLATVKPASPETILEMPSNIAGWAVKAADELLKSLEK